MSAAPFVPRRAYAWARRRILDSFAAGRSVESRRAFDDREELRLVVEARHCLVTLWTFTADLALDTAVPILPPGLSLHEASAWGHQRQEALWSGEAVLTGDARFDAAYVVLGSGPNERPSEEDAQSLSPPLRSLLVERRSDLREAAVEPQRLRLSIPASAERARPSFERGRDRAAWALGVALLDFRSIPSAQDLQAALDHAVALAEALESIRS